MKTLTKQQNEKINTFLSELDTMVNLSAYIDNEEIDFNDAFNSINDILLDNGGFEIEIIYYSEAMKYLTKKDTSLRNALDLASDFGYSLHDINSELLATLLASENAQNDFRNLEDQINEFFLQFN